MYVRIELTVYLDLDLTVYEILGKHLLNKSNGVN